MGEEDLLAAGGGHGAAVPLERLDGARAELDRVRHAVVGQRDPRAQRPGGDLAARPPIAVAGGQHGIGSMPSFATALDDRQLVELTAYLRGRFAPEKPGWEGIEAAVARARKAGR